MSKPHIKRINLPGRPLTWQYKGEKLFQIFPQSILSANW